MQYALFNSFVLRTPLFAWDFISKIVGESITNDQDLADVCNDPVVQEAIYLASPQLFEEMNKWLTGAFGTSKNDIKNIRKLKSALLRYLLRMSTRCTPFGLFAGFTTGCFDIQTEITLQEQNKNTGHTRLDMNYLCALAQDLASKKGIREGLRFYPNSSAYGIADRLRYVEYHYQNGRRRHQIVAVDNNAYLQQILKQASKGALLHELADSIAGEEISS
ncbi:MAG TPA: lantibiotic dehydratase, partial [Prolixibacteraceae bacterium]|nr:lantibiotic dehydratase [Prolixibacteraceae bacterium]